MKVKEIREIIGECVRIRIIDINKSSKDSIREFSLFELRYYDDYNVYEISPYEFDKMLIVIGK